MMWQKDVLDGIDVFRESSYLVNMHTWKPKNQNTFENINNKLNTKLKHVVCLVKIYIYMYAHNIRNT